MNIVKYTTSDFDKSLERRCLNIQIGKKDITKYITDFLSYLHLQEIYIRFPRDLLVQDLCNYFSCDLCVIPIKIYTYIYKLIKEFSFLEYLCSTLKDNISLNILFNNLSNIFFLL